MPAESIAATAWFYGFSTLVLVLLHVFGLCQQVVEVDCVLYDDVTVIKALTLQAAPESLHHHGRGVQPSARYLRLLQAGEAIAALHLVQCHSVTQLGPVVCLR